MPKSPLEPLLTREIIQRGQDAAGIAVCQGGRVAQCKGIGMASKVFDEGKRATEATMPGFMG